MVLALLSVHLSYFSEIGGSHRGAAEQFVWHVTRHRRVICKPQGATNHSVAPHSCSLLSDHHAKRASEWFDTR